ncbi:small acid-soluble spore protein SspI [Oceanobacillus locisalsi]|uniref:Small, acid-soluble spore protein I n=1 Tax=Oceanobacillus locisalsi TaxID=546107 RepID=A0ABW3NJU7_9BACI
MDLNIRKAIYANISNNDQEQLEATIIDAINNGEEKMLPGLGVLFELIWNHSDENEKQEMISSLETGVRNDLS